MGIFDWLARKGRTTQQFIASTIRTSEQMRRYSASNPDHAELVGACFGFAQICATRIAKDVAAVPLRLYKPAGDAMLRDGRAVKVHPMTRRFLASGQAGMKAATYRADDDLEEVTRHPVLDFLAKPNDYQTGMEFRNLQAVFRLLTGSSFAVRDADDNKAHLLFPQYVRVWGGTDSVVGGFTYGRSEKQAVALTTDEVFWSKASPSPFSPLEGLSPLRAVMTEHQIYAAVNQTEIAVFANSGRPDYLVTVEGNIDDDGVTALREKLESYHRTPANAGRPAIIGNSKATITPLGWAPKDLGNVELQRHAISVLIAAFGLPESEVFMNDANLASSVSGNKQYLRQTVMPMAVQDGEEMTRWLVEDMFGLKGWVLAPDNVVGQDQAQEVITLSTAASAGFITVNEGRLRLGYEPVDDPEADKLRIAGVPLGQSGQAPMGGFGFQPFSLEPGDTVTLAADRIPVGKRRRVEAEAEGDLVHVDGQRGDGGGADRQAGTDDDGDAEAGECGDGCGCGDGCRHARLRAVVESAKTMWGVDAVVWAGKTGPADQSPYRDDEPATVRLYRAVAKAIRDRRDEILAATEESPFGLDKRSLTVKEPTPEATNTLVNMMMRAWKVTGQADAFAEATAGLTDKQIADLFNAGVEAGLFQVSEMTTLPELSSDRIQEFFTKYQSAYIKGLASVDDTTAAAVERALRDGIAEGDNLRQMQGRIRDAFDREGSDGLTITEHRAAMVARTETAKATVQGRMGGYAAAGVRKYKFLLAPNSCEFCEGAARKFGDEAVDIGTPLFRQGETLDGADGGSLKLDFEDTVVPIHPNCRCDIVPVVG